MATNLLPYWGFFTGQNQFDYNPANTQAGSEFLQGLRQYDPNATFTQHESGGEGGGGQTFYTLNADLSKIPGFGTAVDLNTQDYAPQYWSPLDSGMTFDQYLQTGGGNFQAPLLNDSAVRTDPVLGQVTDASNVKWPSDYNFLVDVLGPMAVLGFAGAGAAGLLPTWGADAGAAAGLGADAAGAAASNFPGVAAGETGAMDMFGSAGTGLGMGEPGALFPAMGGAEELASVGATHSPLYYELGGSAMGFPSTRVMGAIDSLTGALPNVDLSKIPGVLSKIPGISGLLPGGRGSGGGSGGLLAMAPRAPQNYENLSAILRRYYGNGGLLNG